MNNFGRLLQKGRISFWRHHIGIFWISHFITFSKWTPSRKIWRNNISQFFSIGIKFLLIFVYGRPLNYPKRSDRDVEPNF
jgi:hypothetical protein